MAATTERALVRHLARAISPETEIEICSGQQAIDRDDALIEKVAAFPPGASCIRIWENHNCLVTTRRIARRAAFAEAVAASAQSGWPVYVRSSGGSTVIHRPGILNISLAKAAGADIVQPETSYDDLLLMLRDGLQKLGIEPSIGAIKGAYCDGKYNLCLNGRKIAGTASRIVRRKQQTVYLCHASIAVYGSPMRDISLISAFEQNMGLDHIYAPSSHTTLIELAGF
ncbi:lipoyl protein ligase domain-containing protein [Sphingorhabdus sp. 109]|jgi:lipoate-protein ligase A|uniref:lipoyl protein ligase domain-containing protein n=1 Tax=Sphingorhabdus sp. 109 TaxID=2653173 RepID=UPI0012F0DAE5|nr:hypothetical protein [Sphingorhabdus sp. 109]VWX57251.1 conserved hypothetical protein [Sphingorhabdus sp. 109]